MDVREIDDRYPEYARPYEPTGQGRPHGALPWGLAAGFVLILLSALLSFTPAPPPAPAPEPSAVVPVPEPTPTPPEPPIIIPDNPPEEPPEPPFIPDEPPEEPPTPPPTPPETVRYTVTFVNWDGSVLSRREYDEGTAASAVIRPATPTRPSDGSFAYTFSGWSPDIRAVTGNITYTALYSSTPVAPRFTVTFVNWDGAQISSRQYDEGTAVSGIVVPADPTRPSDGSFRYIFYGWTPDLAPVTADATYTAVYLTEELPSYNITFVDWDGSVLLAATPYTEGTPASDIAVPADPTRADTAEYTYTFAGWSPDLAEVTADATYTATYTQAPRTYTAPTIELVHKLGYWEDADEYFSGFASDITLNDVAGSTGQVRLMLKNPETGVWEQVEFTDTVYQNAIIELYIMQGGTSTELTPGSGPNAAYDIPDGAETLEAVISKHISLYDGGGEYTPRIREIVKIAFDYTLPDGTTGAVETEEFYLYNDWFFGSDDNWVADTEAKTLTLTFPYQVDRGGPIDYDNIYWHPHLYWQPADDYHWGTGGTELDMTPEVSYYTESDGRVFGKIVYTFDTLVPNRIYEFEADVIYSDYGVDDAEHWDNWVVSTYQREMEFDIAAHEAPVIGIFSSAEYGGNSSDWHFGIGAVGCEEIPDDLKGGSARLKFQRFDEDAGAWVDVEFISAADWEANDAKPWSDPTKVEIGDRQMFFNDTVNIGVKDGSSTQVSTLADPTAMIELGDSDYLIASMAYHLPLNHAWEPASTLIRPVMDYVYPDGTTGTAEGQPIRVYSGSFIDANGAVADTEAKTITVDFIYDGGPYAIDPDKANWSHSLHWQDVSDGSYSSERYKDDPDDMHGWVAAEPTMETYAGTDGKTHVRITYTLDEISMDYAYDYLGTVYYFPELEGESGMWEAFPTQGNIRFN